MMVLRRVINQYRSSRSLYTTESFLRTTRLNNSKCYNGFSNSLEIRRATAKKFQPTSLITRSAYYSTHRDQGEEEGVFDIQTKPWDKTKKTLSPKQTYEKRVEIGDLKYDKFQEKVVSQLDELYFNIIKRGQISQIQGRGSDTSEVHKDSTWLQSISKTIFKAKPERTNEEVNIREEEEVRYSVYLFGTVGTGKTMLMDIFHDSLPSHIPKRRVHFHAFMIEVHGRIHKLKQENKGISDPIVPLAADIAREALILCFDELQVTDIADAMILRRLFDELFKNGVSIVTTSNRHPDELYKNGLQRKSFLPCIDLLKKKCQIIDLNSGVDYRKLAVDSNSFFFSPLNESSSHNMNDLFELFTQGKPVKQESVKFLGRELKIPKASNGVARFDFKELCLQPLNAADYLKLATEYHSIFLENIPRIGSLDLNVVRRFITLLDALYENKNTLICTAECDIKNLFSSDENDPDLASMSKADRLLMDDLNLNPSQLASSLFTGEEEKFALARALSRLTEMQSFKWVGHNSRAPLNNNNNMMDI